MIDRSTGFDFGAKESSSIEKQVGWCNDNTNYEPNPHVMKNTYLVSSSSASANTLFF